MRVKRSLQAKQLSFVVRNESEHHGANRNVDEDNVLVVQMCGVVDDQVFLLMDFLK